MSQNYEKEMYDLIKFLNHHTILYNEGVPEISDKEWDDKYFELVELEHKAGHVLEHSPTTEVIFENKAKLEVVEHNHPMLSLAKTKSIDDVYTFFQNCSEVLAMCKMDGLTCSLHYKDGKLVEAETRGNGHFGESVIHNAKVISSIPNRLNTSEELIIDGEIICTYDDFEDNYITYKNPRNFASGSIRLLNSAECAKRKLKFVAWDVIKGFENEKYLDRKLIKLHNDFHFLTVPFIFWDKQKDDEVENLLKEKAQKMSYPIDGLVFKTNDIAQGKEMGATTHHAKNAIAFKFYDETYPTELKTIEWTMGRTGIFTPVAVFNPITIDGTAVERASLHNPNILYLTLGKYPFFRQKINVYKANMIIPQIYDAELIDDVPKEDRIPIISVCPHCGSELKTSRAENGVITIQCVNRACSGLLVNRLEHFCGKKGFDIKGLSKATLEKLIDWKWVSNYTDLFNLSPYYSQWIQKEGFGKTSVQKILESIENSKNIELFSFISALGIPLIGVNGAKQIAMREETWRDFRSNVKNYFNFTTWNGFGPEMCSSLWKFDYNIADQLSCMLNITNSYYGAAVDLNLTVCITGKLYKYKSRNVLKNAIEAHGGRVTMDVSGQTDYLICNDVNSTTSKMIAAQKFNVPVISEEEFIEKFLIDF